jgi:hypothetical protein
VVSQKKLTVVPATNLFSGARGVRREQAGQFKSLKAEMYAPGVTPGRGLSYGPDRRSERIHFENQGHFARASLPCMGGLDFASGSAGRAAPESVLLAEGARSGIL